MACPVAGFWLVFSLSILILARLLEYMQHNRFMHMTFHHEYPATPERVLAMMTDEAWLTEVARRCGATEYQVSVVDGKSHIQVAVAAPAKLQKFVGQTVNVDSTISWDAPDASGARVGTLDVNPPAGVPSTMSGSAKMTPLGDQGESTAVDYEVDFSIQIPLVGKKLEEAAGPYVQRVIDAQYAAGLAYLEN